MQSRETLRSRVLVEYEKSKNIETISFTKKNNNTSKIDGYITNEIIE